MGPRSFQAPRASPGTHPPVRRWKLLAAAVAGAGLTAAVAATVGMHPGETVDLAAVAVAGALAAGLAGWAALLLLRRRSIGLQATAAALTSVGAVVVGAVVAARAMFVEEHDLSALLVILPAAVTVGTVLSLLLGARVERAGQALIQAARRIGGGDLRTPVDPPSPQEFASLARELDEMSRRLDETRERERRLDASRRELVAWVSHDLRTPLAGIRAMAEALEDGIVDDPETVARYHRSMRVETDRLSRLVDELFELSVINAGALRLELERVSLGDVVSDAIASAAAAATARGVRLEGRVEGVAPEVEMSPPQVARVLRNLLENAIRHTPSDGSVWVEAGADGAGAYVAVADECGGIPDRDLERVFEPAFRAESARTPGEDGGAGLGLAIARGIVEAHRGAISVRNQGPGCRFVVRLPLEATGAGPPASVMP